MSYRDWKAGDKVVCVEPWSLKPGLGYGDEVGPTVGQTYTIREIGFFHGRYPNRLQVRLVEIVNQSRPYERLGMWEQCFRASRFRPVQKRSTDISIFTAMLNPSDELAEVPFQ